MKKAIIELYGHDIVLFFEDLSEEQFKYVDAQSFKPEHFKGNIIKSLMNNERKGTFDGLYYIPKGIRGIEFKGQWYVLPRFSDFYKIGDWLLSAKEHQFPTKEMFKEYFGEKKGIYYYKTWVDTCKQEELMYFLTIFHNPDNQDGKLFMDMIIHCVEQFEKENENK